MAQNAYDDTDKGGYSYEEKLELVAKGLMDPKEIGLPPNDEGQQIAQQEQVNQDPKIGDYITFECSEVPIGLRAHWALQELKISPANPRKFEADWIDEHIAEHLIQASIRTGNQLAKLQQLVTEPVLGMLTVMREAADLIEKKYKELQKPPDEAQTVYEGCHIPQGSTETAEAKTDE